MCVWLTREINKLHIYSYVYVHEVLNKEIILILCMYSCIMYPLSIRTANKCMHMLLLLTAMYSVWLKWEEI